MKPTTWRRTPPFKWSLEAMRNAHLNWVDMTFDSGLIPEALMHQMAQGGTIYELLRDPKKFPQEEILTLNNSLFEEELPENKLLQALEDSHPLIRYWALNTLQSVPSLGQSLLLKVESLLSDEFPSVSLMAAYTLCKKGDCNAAFEPIKRHLESGDKRIRLLAARTFEQLIEKAPQSIIDDISSYFQQQCPEENWQNFYELYTCWALQEGFAMINP